MTLYDDYQQLAQRQAELEQRQNALSVLFESIMQRLDSMAENLRAHAVRTRKRVFIEQAAVRLLPAIYGHMTHNSEYDRQTMAKSALDRAFALWEETEARFEPEKDDTDD